MPPHLLLPRTLVFPPLMQFQVEKISASGGDLGGKFVFKKRVGFTGTLSSMLPMSMGACGFNRGTEGEMVHVLTEPSIVKPIGGLGRDWTSKSLLDMIAKGDTRLDGPLHALIDTGALVTGMSNFEVARALLELGLHHMRGCVFIDDDGHKRILLRDGLRVMRLEQCGLALSERFTFYDQVHTMGMDIPQPQASHAALTLSKDMTFRDYAQVASQQYDAQPVVSRALTAALTLAAPAAR